MIFYLLNTESDHYENISISHNKWELTYSLTTKIEIKRRVTVHHYLSGFYILLEVIIT